MPEYGLSLFSLPKPLSDTNSESDDYALTARNFLTRPPTDTPRRVIRPGEGLSIFITSR